MFRSAVLNAGYRISSTHVNPLGVKSDAPWDVIWDIMRCWVNTPEVPSLKYELVDVIHISAFKLCCFFFANFNTGEESSYQGTAP
jgi:hypothetical protein